MFVLQTLGRLLQGQINSNELVQISGGSFRQRVPSDALLFKDAQLTIRRTSIAFQYQLVVTRVFEEGEDELDDDDALDDERAYLIDRQLKFHKAAMSNGNIAFTWSDMDGGAFEFLVDASQANKHTVDFFETTLLECVFERVFQKSRELASLADLESLKYEYGIKYICPMDNNGCSPARNASPAKASASITTVESPVFAQVLPQGEVLSSCLCDLYLYQPGSCEFVLKAKSVKLEVLQTGPFAFRLVLADGPNVYLVQPIDNSMNPSFSREHQSFIWVYSDDESNRTYSWSVKFRTPTDEKAFHSTFSRCMYETLNKEAFGKVKGDDQEYLMDTYYNDVDMEDVSESDRDQDELSSEGEPESFKESSPLRIPDEDASAKNSQLAVGYKHQRSFVVRGNKIGVFKNDHDDLEFSTAINNISTPKGKLFSPAKVMLHDQDSKMILLDPSNSGKLFQMDLEYGKVVDEWKVDQYDREVKDFTHDTKYGQMTPQKTFVGMSHNAFFRIDPRQSGTKLVESEMNQYKSKNEFSCTATTGTGDLVVASDKGDIRLYDKIQKRAKTHLPGLGDPIVGIDVTEDGKYILATCKTYILVIPTEAKKEGESVSGFNKSLGSEKPIPKRLQLKPEHVAWMNAPVSFTPARFNTGSDMEKTIVTSTGAYLITWNFRRVKAGHTFDYSIKKYPTKVVAENFRYGTDKNVIVALPDDVTMVSKQQFQSPNKLFAPGTPARGRNLRDSVVNSPY